MDNYTTINTFEIFFHWKLSLPRIDEKSVDAQGVYKSSTTSRKTEPRKILSNNTSIKKCQNMFTVKVYILLLYILLAYPQSNNFLIHWLQWIIPKNQVQSVQIAALCLTYSVKTWFLKILSVYQRNIWIRTILMTPHPVTFSNSLIVKW